MFYQYEDFEYEVRRNIQMITLLKVFHDSGLPILELEKYHIRPCPTYLSGGYSDEYVALTAFRIICSELISDANWFQSSTFFEAEYHEDVEEIDIFEVLKNDFAEYEKHFEQCSMYDMFLIEDDFSNVDIHAIKEHINKVVHFKSLYKGYVSDNNTFIGESDDGAEFHFHLSNDKRKAILSYDYSCVITSTVVPALFLVELYKQLQTQKREDQA